MSKFLSLLSLIVVALTNGLYSSSEKPNILFFLVDDQRPDVLGAYGHPTVQTPTIDRLAAEGIRFDNSFCQVPICASSRAVIFSGLSQRTHGYNFGELPVPSKFIKTSYPMLLKNANYRIGFAGKYGMKFDRPSLKKNFHFFRSIGRDPYLKKSPDGTLRHETDLCADAAIEFIKTNPNGKPFCMSVSFNATHAEDKDHRPGYHFQWPESTDGLYEDVDFPDPRLAAAAFYEALPSFIQDPDGLSRLRFNWRWDTPEKYQTNMRAYFRMVTGIDNAISRVLATLKDQGLAENTIVIYSSDNGFMMGDRGTAGKWNHYEQSLRVPLIIYDPRLPEEKRGRARDQLISNVDLPATFVDYAGVTIPDVYQGLSLRPLIESKNEVEWREEIFCEHKFKRYSNWHGVRSDRYKYVHYYDNEYQLLYDLKEDPDEVVNLIDSPAHQNVVKDMKARLSSYLNDYPLAVSKKAKKNK